MQFFQKLNIELLYDPATPLLGVCPKELKDRTADFCISMFKAAGLKVAKRQKHKYPSADPSVKRSVLYPHVQPTETKAILTHATVWANLEGNMLSDLTHSQKDKHCMTLLT